MTVTLEDLRPLIGKDIEFLRMIEDYDWYGEVGMRATVLGVYWHDESDVDDPVFKLHLSFAKYDDHNRQFESTNYWDNDGKATWTARQANAYSVEDHLYLGNNWASCVKLVDGAADKLFNLFLTDKASQPDINYVQWLETLVLAAMPHLKSKED